MKSKSPSAEPGNERRTKIAKINQRAAGIDIGSRQHYAAVGSEVRQENVRSFGCYTADLQAMASWFKECGITTIAMESTGVYWIPAYQVLEEAGFEVVLVNSQAVKNVPGRKTDVLDCQWIQELHSYGLLRGSFMPSEKIAALRGYWRHRESLVRSCARQVQLLQKSLEQMNLQIHKVLTDISGVTGMRIMRAIVAGERDGAVLARMRCGRVKSSDEDLIKALTGNYRQEHLFSLKQRLQTYDFLQTQLKDCDDEIQQCLASLHSSSRPTNEEQDAASKKTLGNKKMHFNAKEEVHRILGVDLTRIDGIDAMTALTVLSEIGSDVSKFSDEKHFASWLCLCPNNKKTGGKVKSRPRPDSEPLGQRLTDGCPKPSSRIRPLGAYYRRMRMRLGAQKATIATRTNSLVSSTA